MERSFQQSKSRYSRRAGAPPIFILCCWSKKQQRFSFKMILTFCVLTLIEMHESFSLNEQLAFCLAHPYIGQEFLSVSCTVVCCFSFFFISW